jgi:hypothetical protein
MAWGLLFQPAVIAFLEVGASESLTVTSQAIAAAYHLNAQLVMPTLIPGSLPLTLPGPIGIGVGLEASFKLAQAISSGPPPSSVWLPAASAVIAYWTGAQFSPMPPPPGGLLGINNTVLFPGIPNTLAEDLGTAFKAGQPAQSAQEGAVLVASALSSAFQKHLLTISGLWTGTAPGLPPIPFAFPWIGLT